MFPGCSIDIRVLSPCNDEVLCIVLNVALSECIEMGASRAEKLEWEALDEGSR